MKNLSNEEKCMFYGIAQKIGYQITDFTESLLLLFERDIVCFHFINYCREGEVTIKKTTRIKDLFEASEALKNLKYDDAYIDFIF